MKMKTIKKPLLAGSALLGTVGAFMVPASVAHADTPVYPHIWSASSPAYKTMPTNAPLDPNSNAIVSNINSYGIKDYGDKTRGLPGMTLNNDQYSNSLYTATNADPAYDIQFNDCQHKGWTDPNFINQLKGVHIPNNATPPSGTDSPLTVYNKDSGRYVDLWVAHKTNGTWSACWGGSITNAATSDTSFQKGYGASASGLALEPYTVKVSELQAGHIDHPVSIALPVEVVDNYISKPANRTDGSFTKTNNSISEGQYLKLPASLNIDSMNLAPVAKMIAKAGQKYGFIVTDRSGSISFSLQNKNQFATDPYTSLFQGLPYWKVMWGDDSKGQVAFPFDKLQVVQKDYTPPTTTTPAPSTNVSITPNHNKTAFGFTVNNAPSGSYQKITWVRNGQTQITRTGTKNWWSGDQTGWTQAYSQLLSSSTGHVIATSPIIHNN